VNTNTPLLYENIKDNPHLNGVFCYLDLERCFPCSEFMKEIKMYDTKDWNLVVMDENGRKELQSMGLDVPLTRYFVNGKIEYEIQGILYPTQIRELYDVIQGKVMGTRKTKIPDFRHCAPKNDVLDCFRATEFMGLDILGQHIEIRNGQWLVLHKDNKCEVMTDEDFNRRYNLQ